MGWTFGYDMIIQLLDGDFNADITVVVEKVGAGVIYVCVICNQSYKTKRGCS